MVKMLMCLCKTRLYTFLDSNPNQICLVLLMWNALQMWNALKLKRKEIITIKLYHALLCRLLAFFSNSE